MTKSVVPGSGDGHPLSDRRTFASKDSGLSTAAASTPSRASRHRPLPRLRGTTDWAVQGEIIRRSGRPRRHERDLMQARSIQTRHGAVAIRRPLQQICWSTQLRRQRSRRAETCSYVAGLMRRSRPARSRNCMHSSVVDHCRLSYGQADARLICTKSHRIRCRWPVAVVGKMHRDAASSSRLPANSRYCQYRLHPTLPRHGSHAAHPGEGT